MPLQDPQTPVNLGELIVAALISLGVGVIRLLVFIRKSKGAFKFVDVMLEPLLAMFAGMLMWSIMEYLATPDILQAAMTSVGAYGGTKTIHWAERRYLGGSRIGDPPSDKMPLDKVLERKDQ
jgi:hypothetical protein